MENPQVDPANNRIKEYQDADGVKDYEYDLAGNTKKDADGRSFTYDAENKQIKVEGNNQLIGIYWYDGDGKRVKKKGYVNGVLKEENIFVYDAHGKLIAEYSNQTTIDSQVSYLTDDSLGTARINTDKNGKVISRHDYHPFGEEINRSSYGSDSVRKKFTGYEHDDETNLDYAKTRMFESSLGRFMSVDPAKMTKERVADPQHWNLYVYARNNPILMIDLNGEFPWTFHICSFIYTSTVGGGLFRGDGRGPSLATDNPAITSRVRLSFTLDYNSGRITNNNLQSDYTLFYGAGVNIPPQERTGSPNGVFGNVESVGNSKDLSLHYWGKDPITPGIATPDLDVHASISISESYNADKSGKLFINGIFTGDKYPSTEAFVVDQSGKTKVFLGVKYEEGGVGNLYGDNKEDLFKVDIQIKFDKKGRFTAVIENGKTYTIDAWNKKIKASF